MDGQHNPPEPVHEPGTRKGEESGGEETGRQDTGTTESGRATGTATSKDFTGINPADRNPIDPDSPTITTP